MGEERMDGFPLWIQISSSEATTCKGTKLHPRQSEDKVCWALENGLFLVTCLFSYQRLRTKLYQKIQIGSLNFSSMVYFYYMNLSLNSIPNHSEAYLRQ